VATVIPVILITGSAFVAWVCCTIICNTFSKSYLEKNGSLAFWDSYPLVLPFVIALVVFGINTAELIQRYDPNAVFINKALHWGFYFVGALFILLITMIVIDEFFLNKKPDTKE